MLYSPRWSPSPNPRPGRARARRARGRYSRREEVANALTHGAGAALALVGLVLLLVAAARRGAGWHLASAVVYGVSMVMLYGSSTLYHALAAPRAKHVSSPRPLVHLPADRRHLHARHADHAARPRRLVALRRGLGCALVGIAAEAFWVYRPKWLSVLVYVAMGWLAIFMIKPLIAACRRAGCGCSSAAAWPTPSARPSTR